jgi:hypothetical protein
MIIFLSILALLTVILLWYALYGREWLKTKPWAAGFFAWIEPIEITLFKKSETILVARLLSVLGFILTFLNQIGSIDITPIIPFVPEKYASIVQIASGFMPLLISGLGFIVERLRNTTTQPIELVAVPDKVVAANPVVAEAVAMANTTKTEAVQAVVVAKAA